MRPYNYGENRMKTIEQKLLEMAINSKEIEKLLIDYNPSNKKVIDNFKNLKKEEVSK